SAESNIRYLMLQDGGLVEGQITPAADWYIVARSGGQLQVAKSRVLFACRTLEEGYAYRRQQINDPKPGPHPALAQSCLRYGMLTGGDHELAGERRLESDHPRLARLERRLEKMRSPATKTPKQEVTPNKQPMDAGDLSTKKSPTFELPDGVVERFTRKVQ